MWPLSLCTAPSCGPHQISGLGAILAITANSTHPSVYLSQNLGLVQRGRGKRKH